MAKSRSELPNRNKYRNLTQYKNMTDDQFEVVWEKISSNIKPSANLEERIEGKLAEFERDYDLTDLKVNDMLVLRSLIQAILQLEDMEQAVFKERSGGISPDKVAIIRDINNVMSTLRQDISRMQTDLRITRKLRKGDKEQSTITFIEDLKVKARKFYEQSSSYIYCPKCNMLLGTAWFLYPEGKNKITLTCNRTTETGEPCGEVVTLTSKELIEMRGTNKQDVPEAMI